MYKIKRLFNKIVKLVTFIPIIWKDEDWDYTYMLKILETKLTFMLRYFKRSEILEDKTNQEIIDGIKKTLNYINRFMNFDSFDISEVEPPFEIQNLSVPTENGAYQFVTVRKETGNILDEEEEKQYVDYLVKLNNKENEYWEGIFNTIRDEGRKWWD